MPLGSLLSSLSPLVLVGVATIHVAFVTALFVGCSKKKNPPPAPAKSVPAPTTPGPPPTPAKGCHTCHTCQACQEEKDDKKEEKKEEKEEKEDKEEKKEDKKEEKTDEAKKSQKEKSKMGGEKKEGEEPKKEGEDAKKEEEAKKAEEPKKEEGPAKPTIGHTELKWTKAKGTQPITVKCGAERMAVKVKCSDNALYRIDPVFSFVEPGAELKIFVHRIGETVKADKMVIIMSKAKADDKDAAAAVKADTAPQQFTVAFIVEDKPANP